MVQYRVDIDGTTFNELDNVTGESTINPFGDRFVVTFRDFEGDKFDSISINSTAEIYAREPTPPNQSNNSYDKIFEGYIVQADTRTEGGADILDITIYTFDQLIRNETVSNDQTDKQIDAILKNIIQTDTPVEWVAGNVAVQDNRKIRRSLQGVKVEEALRFLSRRSENEEYGVNADKEFFFSPRKESNADVDITDNDAIDYNIPSRGKEQKTEVTCFYDGGDEDITVTLGSEQLQAQEDFGTQDAVPFPDEINRPTITNRQEALEIARNFARDREETLAGQVIAVGSKALVDANVGDSIDITLTTRGLDDEFTIVSKEVDYIKNEVALGIVEKRGDQDSLLKAIGQQVKRNELQNADQTQKPDLVEQTQVQADITTVIGSGGFETKLTTIGRNKLRDALDDGSQPGITTAILGDGDSVSRTDASVPNQQDTDSVTVSNTTADSITFDFSFTGTGNIVGFEDSDDDLIIISGLGSEITNFDSNLRIVVGDDTENKGVLTADGQNMFVDLINPNTTADVVEAVRFGDGGSDPQASDTSLDSLVNTVTFDNRTIQSALLTSGFNNALQDSERIYAENDTLKLAQSGFVEEGENSFSNPTNGETISDVDYSDGAGAVKYDGSVSPVTFTFDLNYEIDAANAVIVIRSEDLGGANEVGVEFDNTTITATFGQSSIGWETYILGNNGFSGSISTGSHTIELFHNATAVSKQDGVIIDLVGFVDNTYIDETNLDNTLHQNSGYLDDPQKYPTSESIDLQTIAPRQSVKNATLDVSINDTSNNQSLTIGNGQTTTANNTSNVSQDFDPTSQTVNGTITLDGFGKSGSQTPRQRFNGQEITEFTVTSDYSFHNPTEVGRVDIEAFLTASEADGTAYQEAGQSDGTNLLTRSIYPEFTSDNQAVILSEDLGIDIS